MLVFDLTDRLVGQLLQLPQLEQTILQVLTLDHLSLQRDLAELVAVLRDAGHSRHGVRVKNQDHERRIRDAVPLAREAVRGGGLEPEARVILRMSDDDNERTAALAEDVQTSPHELRADALPLAIRA